MFDPNASHEVTVREEAYQNWPDGSPMLAAIYEPVGTPGPHPVLVDVHGGAWAMGERTQGKLYCYRVATRGAVVISVDFRDGRNAKHPAASQDVCTAIDWVIANAQRLGVDPQRVALSGSSSGGHIALYAATKLGARVNFVAGLWPPTDPLARYRYAKAMIGKPVPEGQTFTATGLVANTEMYYEDQNQMSEASIARLVRAGEAAALPPAWIVQAERDMNVPAAILNELVAMYKHAGGTIDRTVFKDQVHAFGHSKSEATDQFIAELCERLVPYFS